MGRPEAWRWVPALNLAAAQSVQTQETSCAFPRSPARDPFQACLSLPVSRCLLAWPISEDEVWGLAWSEHVNFNSTSAAWGYKIRAQIVLFVAIARLTSYLICQFHLPGPCVSHQGWGSFLSMTRWQILCAAWAAHNPVSYSSLLLTALFF